MSSPTAMLSVLFVLLCGLLLVQGQSCLSPSDPSVQARLSNLRWCAPYVTYAVYPTSAAADTITYRVGRSLGTLSGAMTGASKSCIDASFRYLCSLAFPPCVQYATFNAYAQPCADTCLPVFDGQCNVSLAATIQALNATSFNLLVPCNAPASGNPNIVSGNTFGDTVWSVNGTQTTVSCQSQALQTAQMPCYHPYENASASNPLGYCQQICPAALIDNYPQIAYPIAAYGWFGLVTIPVIAVLRTTVPKFAAYPANLVVLLLAGWTLACFGFVSEIWWKQILCPGNVPVVNNSYTMCAIQAFWLQFGLLTYAFTWVTICIHSAVTVILRRNIFGKISFIISFCVCLLVPLLLSLVAAGGQSYATRPSAPFCFIGPAAYSWGTFFAWVVACAFVGVICIVITVGTLTVTSISGSSDSIWHIKHNIRIVVFMVLGLLVEVVGTAYRATADVQAPAWIASYGAYAGCSLFAPGCSRGTLPDQWSLAVMLYLMFSPCISIPIFFGSNKELWTDWGNRKWPWQAWSISGNTDTGTTAGSSSSSSSGSADGSTFMSDLQ